MTDRERRDYFFFVMRSWRLEMERSQQYLKAMETADAGGAAAAGTQAAAAATTAAAPAAQPEPEVAPGPQATGVSCCSPTRQRTWMHHPTRPTTLAGSRCCAVAGSDPLGLPPQGEPPAPAADAAAES